MRVELDCGHKSLALSRKILKRMTVAFCFTCRERRLIKVIRVR